jgi:hypothetical protein
MLMSGLRLEEAAKLRPCDLVEVEGVHCFDINSQAGRLKGKSSARLVQIHSTMQPHLSQWATKVSTEDGPQGNLWRDARVKRATWRRSPDSSPSATYLPAERISLLRIVSVAAFPQDSSRPLSQCM